MIHLEELTGEEKNKVLDEIFEKEKRSNLEALKNKKNKKRKFNIAIFLSQVVYIVSLCFYYAMFWPIVLFNRLFFNTIYCFDYEMILPWYHDKDLIEYYEVDSRDLFKSVYLLGTLFSFINYSYNTMSNNTEYLVYLNNSISEILASKNIIVTIFQKPFAFIGNFFLESGSLINTLDFTDLSIKTIVFGAVFVGLFIAKWMFILFFSGCLGHLFFAIIIGALIIKKLFFNGFIILDETYNVGANLWLPRCLHFLERMPVPPIIGKIIIEEIQRRYYKFIFKVSSDGYDENKKPEMNGCFYKRK